MTGAAVLLADALAQLNALTDSVADAPVRERLKAGLGAIERHVDALVDEQRRIAEQHRQLVDLARRDELTELYNSRHLLACLETEFRRAVRYMLPLSLIVGRVDDFGALTESRGSLVANEILRRVARSVRAALRDTDVAARYGTETFVVLLPQTRAVDAACLAERIRESIASLPERVTVSIGVASLGARIAEPLDLLDEAGRAMAQVKKGTFAWNPGAS